MLRNGSYGPAYFVTEIITRFVDNYIILNYKPNVSKLMLHTGGQHKWIFCKAIDIPRLEGHSFVSVI